jgi:hypothetical protein
MHPCQFDAQAFDVPATAIWMAEQEPLVAGVFKAGGTVFNRDSGPIVLTFMSASADPRD